MTVIYSERIQLQRGQHDEVKYVEKNIHRDIDQLQGGKLDGAFLVAKIGKRDALEGI